MSVRGSHWSLFDKRTSSRVDGLSYDEARVVMCVVPEDEIVHWYIWKSTWLDWRHAGDIEGLCEPLNRKIEEEPPPAPIAHSRNPKGMLSAVKDIVDDEEVSLKVEAMDVLGEQAEPLETSDFVARKHRRYQKRYEVYCTNGTEEFSTFSQDVSVGGLYLEESLPDWVTGYFKVRIRKLNQRHQVELTCCIVENQDPGKRLRLSILPFTRQEDERNLEMWLAA